MPGKAAPPSAVRPLDRASKGRWIPATPPDRSESWEEHGLILRADMWDKLVLKNAKPGAPTFAVIAFHDPNFINPLLVATSLTIAARDVRLLYLDRWPVEQLPLAAKQMIGAHRAFVFAEKVCQRLPKLALLTGAILSYVAAVLPAMPTGSGIASRSPPPAGCAASWPAADFLQISRCHLKFVKKRLSPTICRRDQACFDAPSALRQQLVSRK
jgi:hypothetical protein